MQLDSQTRSSQNLNSIELDFIGLKTCFTIFEINTGSVDIRHVRSQEFRREKYHSLGPRNRVENFPLEMTCIMNFMREGEMIHDDGVRQSPDLAQNSKTFKCGKTKMISSTEHSMMKFIIHFTQFR